MQRVGFFLYGLVCYLAFLGVFAYAVGFIGGFLTPTSLDAPATSPAWFALLINTGLLTLFALQHSVMARPAFKKRWTKIVPKPIERSTYVMATNIALALVFAFWQPLGGEVWTVTNPVGRIALWSGYALGWAIVLAATLQINHFDLFGLRQVWLHLKSRPYTALKFQEPLLYRVVRHPLYVGWFLCFWCTPRMTAAHLFFAAVTTAYILVAIQLEERDLVREHGDSYAAYRRRVPMLLPRFGRKQVKPAPAPVGA
ncbi:MAG: methanethiol S-methyltransferase [Phycisphaerales bacterium]